MANFNDITGQRFNNLTVISQEPNDRGGVTRWLCLCDCGKYTTVRGSNLKNGSVKSCGCLRHKKPYNWAHGKSQTKDYRKWISMKRRCNDKTDPHYDNYGGRGIKVCDEWATDFNSFLEWVSKTRVDDDLTLERIDVNGDYCPDNCTWVDRKSQANNRTSNLVFTYKGETKNLMQWCEDLGLKYVTIYSRIYRNGWDFEKAITTPVITDGYAMKKWREKNG